MRAWRAFGVIVVLACMGCSGGGGDVDQAARDRLHAQEAWKLVFEHDGTTHEVPVECIDIYLTEDESDPEIFELHGEGVTLVGEFPAGVRVDYEEALERLIGTEVEIQAHGGDPREPKTSRITLDGVVTPVSAGTFTVQQLTGKWSGSEGDRTLHGSIELRVRDMGGERTLRGRFGAHAITWG